MKDGGRHPGSLGEPVLPGIPSTEIKPVGEALGCWGIFCFCFLETAKCLFPYVKFEVKVHSIETGIWRYKIIVFHRIQENFQES